MIPGELKTMSNGKPKPVKPVTPRKDSTVLWVLILSLGALVVTMLAPLIFSLALNLELHSTRDVSPQDMAGNYALPGAMKEKLDMSTSTDYLASFVPTRLTTRAFPFSAMEFFYGPALLAGSSIDLVPTKETIGQGFTGTAGIRLRGVVPVMLFYLLLIGLMVILHLAFSNSNQALRFIIGLAITWFLYSVIISLLSGLLTRPALDVINTVLGHSTNPLKYAPPLWDILDAPLKVFVVGMIYWVLVYMSRRARVEAAEIKKAERPPRPA
jgi:hypothetical protein